MGLLADIYSTIDTGKRRLKGLLDDPAGTIDAGARRFREDNQANIGNMLTGFGLLGNNSVLMGDTQRSAAQQSVADVGANMGIAGMLSADLKNELANKYRELIKSDPYGKYGVRVFGPDQKSDVGTKLARSSNWVDGVPKTTKLPGTAVFELRPNSADKAIDRALNYNIGVKGAKVGLVRGDELAPHRMPESYSALIKSPVVQHIYDWPSDL